MTKNSFKIGDVVKVAREDDETYWTHGLTGIVVATQHDRCSGLDVLVEFNTKDAKDQGHNDAGGTDDNRWWIRPACLDLVTDELTIGAVRAPGHGHFRDGSQVSTVLAHLLRGKSITNNESMLVYGIYRLSDCIHKIREAGYDVLTDIKTDEVGRKYSSYHLAAKA